MRLLQTGLWITSLLLVHTSLWANFSEPPVPDSYSFRQLVHSLKRGANVSAIVHYKYCVLKAGGEAISSREDTVISERFNFYDFIYKQLRKGNQSRQVVITTHESIVPGQNGEFFRRYARLRIFDDNTAEIYSVIFNLMGPSSQAVTSTIWQCQISQGQDGYGLFLWPTTSVGPPLYK